MAALWHLLGVLRGCAFFAQLFCAGNKSRLAAVNTLGSWVLGSLSLAVCGLFVIIHMVGGLALARLLRHLGYMRAKVESTVRKGSSRDNKFILLCLLLG